MVYLWSFLFKVRLVGSDFLPWSRLLCSLLVLSVLIQEQFLKRRRQHNFIADLAKEKWETLTGVSQDKAIPNQTGY
jgi:hypothetical protein